MRQILTRLLQKILLHALILEINLASYSVSILGQEEGYTAEGSHPEKISVLFFFLQRGAHSLI